MKLQLITNFNTQVEDLIDTAYKIEDQYTTIANRLIDDIDQLLSIEKKDIPISDLLYYIAQIPIVIYNLTDSIQELAVKTDAAKMERRHKFNETYLREDTGTVAHKTSIAQQHCQDEQFLEDVFTRVYKQCERKIDILEMLHSSLKKILSWRDTEMQVTRTNMMSNGGEYYGN